MKTRDEFEQTAWNMTYEEYVKCHCPECDREACRYREKYCRVPEVDGGLGLCPRLKGE